MNKKDKINLFIIVLIVFGIDLFFCFCKNSFSIDESLSYSLSNTVGGFLNFKRPIWLTNEFFNQIEVQTNRFNYSQVIVNQVNDVHPPMYYFLVHTICSIFNNKLSLWFGLSINIFFSIIIAVFIYLIFIDVTNSNFEIFLIELLFSTHFIFVNQLINTRMYEMLMAISLALFYISYIICFKNNKKINYLYLWVISYIGCLTHYYFYIALGIICVTSLIVLLIKKQYANLIAAIITITMSIVLALITFPATINHLFRTGHGSYAMNFLENGLGGLSFKISAITNLNYEICTLIIICLFIMFIILLVYLMKSLKDRILKIKQESLFFMIVSVFLLVGIVFIFLISKFKTVRYVCHLYLLLAISLLYLFNKVFVNERIRITTLIITIVVGINYNLISKLSEEKSWQFAKNNNKNEMIVITTKEYDPWEINTLFMDYMGYEKIGFTNIDEDFDFSTNDVVFYICKEIDYKNAERYIEDITKKDIDLKKKSVETTFFDVYELN